MDVLRQLSGLPFSDDRMAELLEKYQPILSEIEKFRRMDLKDTHPAVYFDPLAAYSSKPETTR